MKVEISDQYGNILDSQIVSVNSTESATYLKFNHKSVKPYWSSTVSEIKAGANHIAIHEVEIRQQVKIKTMHGPRSIGMLFIEKGRIGVRQTDNTIRKIGSLQHNIIYNAQQTEETIFDADQKLRLITINLHPKYFMELAGGGSKVVDKVVSCIHDEGSNVFATGENLHIGYPMLRLLNSLDSQGYNPATSRLATEAKILELLSLQLTQTAQESEDKTLAKLSESDIARLHIAKEFILDDISYTPTLEEIAMQAGINMYKLKTGFKALFGHSVFRYLREKRMEAAYEKVGKRNQSLTEIAYLSGFGSISHFSDAFRKRYGVSPGRLR